MVQVAPRSALGSTPDALKQHQEWNRSEVEDKIATTDQNQSLGIETTHMSDPVEHC